MSSEFEQQPKKGKKQKGKKAIILMYSSAQCSVIERVLLPTKDFTNGPETNVRRKKKMPRMNRVKGSNGNH